MLLSQVCVFISPLTKPRPPEWASLIHSIIWNRFSHLLITFFSSSFSSNHTYTHIHTLLLLLPPPSPSHGLWVQREPGCGCPQRHGDLTESLQESQRRGAESAEEDFCALLPATSVSGGVNPDTMQPQLGPWRTVLLLLAVTWQPGAADRYGKMVLMVEVGNAVSPAYLSHVLTVICTGLFALFIVKKGLDAVLFVCARELAPGSPEWSVATDWDGGDGCRVCIWVEGWMDHRHTESGCVFSIFQRLLWTLPTCLHTHIFDGLPAQCVYSLTNTFRNGKVVSLCFMSLHKCLIEGEKTSFLCCCVHEIDLKPVFLFPVFLRQRIYGWK